MKRPLYILIGMLVILAVAAGFYAASKAVARNDARIFGQYDKHQLAMLARNCGSKGRLMQDPINGGFSCYWENKDGSSVMAETPSYRYLNNVALK